MIKRYSTKRLRLLNRLFWLSLSRIDIRNATKDYIKSVSREVCQFENKLKECQTPEEIDVKRLTRLFSLAITFRCNKKLKKTIVNSVFVTPVLVFLTFTQVIIPLIFAEEILGFWDYVLIFLGSNVLNIFLASIFLGITKFITNIEVKIGRAISYLFKGILILVYCCIIFLPLDAVSPVLKWIVLGCVYQLYLIIVITFLERFLKTLIDIGSYAKKIQITDALIMESSFRLSNMNWNLVIRRRTKRQDALNELERLARLIENDWSAHMKTGDEKTTKWKNNTFKGIAEGIRSLKKQIIQPDPETPIQLKSAFEGIFQKIVNHDIKGLVGAEVPAVRIHKPSKLKAFKSVIVAILPLVLTLTLKFMNLEGIPENYTTVGVTIAALWLLISVLLWMDPNLADRIATISSARRLFKSKQEEE